MITFTCTNVLAVNIYDEINTATNEVDVSGIVDFGNSILKVITTVGQILSVIIVAILGVKYMMGSTEEKAEYKKTMMPYLIGAILVFGATTIGKMVYNFTNR